MIALQNYESDAKSVGFLSKLIASVRLEKQLKKKKEIRYVNKL